MRHLTQLLTTLCVIWPVVVMEPSPAAAYAPAPKTGDSRATADVPEFPDSVAGRRAAAFFQAYAAGTDEAVRAFEATHRAESALKRRSIDDRIRQYHELRADWGALTIGQLVVASERDVSVIVHAERPDEWLDFRFELEKEPPYKLLAIAIQGPAPPPGELAKIPPLDEKMRAEVVDEIAKILDEAYVYPKLGRQMAETVRANAAKGAYDELTHVRSFADRLTQDLRDICYDRHLRVRVGAAPAKDAAPEDEEARRTLSCRRNFGLELVQRLSGNVGYLKFNHFSGLEEAKKTAAAAMNFLANSDAIIFDLRENGGGSPEMIAFLSSYIFDKPTHLNSFYHRREDKTTETWTQADVPGERFGQDKPVYVLTSRSTFSGAEEFTYNLKNLKRGTIVGETTGGGAHPVFMHGINDFFSVSVPYARAINPITKTNWEGVGVKPDIAVPAEQALLTAQKEALGRLLKIERDDERTRSLRAALRRIETELAAIDGTAAGTKP